MVWINWWLVSDYIHPRNMRQTRRWGGTRYHRTPCAEDLVLTNVYKNCWGTVFCQLTWTAHKVDLWRFSTFQNSANIQRRMLCKCLKPCYRIRQSDTLIQEWIWKILYQKLFFGIQHKNLRISPPPTSQGILALIRPNFKDNGGKNSPLIRPYFLGWGWHWEVTL